MADGNLSLSLSNKGSVGGFSLKNVISKPTTNTFGNQGFKANTKNISNVNTKQVSKVTKAAKVEPPPSGEEKAPIHDVVYSSTPPPPTVVNDILGVPQVYAYGTTKEQALNQSLGPGWQSKIVWNLADGFVQGLTLLGTGGASTVAFAGRTFDRLNVSRQALLGVKAGFSTLRYRYDPAQQSGPVPNSWGYSFALGLGGQIKFGNIADILGKYGDHGSKLYKLAHTSHHWHEWAQENNISLFNNYGKVSLFGGTFGVTNLYNSFGLDNLEKQWFTGSGLYKGRFNTTPPLYSLQMKIGDGNLLGAEFAYGTLDFRNNRDFIEANWQNAALDEEKSQIDVTAGKSGNAYQRYLSRDAQNAAMKMNWLGDYVYEHENKRRFLEEQIAENRLWIQNYNWEVKENLINGDIFQKVSALAEIVSGVAIGRNLFTGARNLLYFGRSVINTGTTTVVQPFASTAYDIDLAFAVNNAITDPTKKPKVGKQVVKALGVKELYVNQTKGLKGKSLRFATQDEIRNALGIKTYEYDFSLNTKRDIEAEAKKDKVNKTIYDARAKLQKEYEDLKKQHNSSFMGIFAKPWTPEENERRDYLVGWIKTYNETIAIIENGIRRTPPKNSVETPKQPSWMQKAKKFN
jgi:hypothetical protein